MKYACTLIFLFFLASGSVFSQSKKEFVHSEFGIKGGGYLFPVHMVDSLKATTFNGTLLGVRFLHFEEKNAAVLVECNYNRVSYNKYGQFFSYDFLQFPALAHFYIPISRVSFTIDLGTYGMALLSKNKNVYSDRGFLYGLAGGAALSYSFTKFTLGFDSRYYFNLDSNNNDDDTMRNKWFEFSVILGFRGKPRKSTKPPRLKAE